MPHRNWIISVASVASDRRQRDAYSSRRLLGLTHLRLEALEDRRLLATFAVNTTADLVDLVPGDGVCDAGGGQCSLRAAIMEANALVGADTITLPSGIYDLTIDGADEDASATGDLDITDDLTINGAGYETTIVDASSITDRVLQVSSASVALDQVTLQGGNSVIRGGGIYNDTAC